MSTLSSNFPKRRSFNVGCKKGGHWVTIHKIYGSLGVQPCEKVGLLTGTWRNMWVPPPPSGVPRVSGLKKPMDWAFNPGVFNNTFWITTRNLTIYRVYLGSCVGKFPYTREDVIQILCIGLLLRRLPFLNKIQVLPLHIFENLRMKVWKSSILSELKRSITRF